MKGRSENHLLGQHTKIIVSERNKSTQTRIIMLLSERRVVPHWGEWPRDVFLPGTQALDDRFDDWVALLEFRDAQAKALNAESIQFKIGDRYVCFSLDTILKAEKKDSLLQLRWKFPNFTTLFFHHGSEVMKNVVFFRPKGGPYKDDVFRFTVGQDPIQGATNVFAPVLLQFIRLLLSGPCDFSEISYYARPELFSNPGMNNIWIRRTGLPCSFPQLPLVELLPRSDTHEFIRVSFDPQSCEALGNLTSPVDTLSFTCCKFFDRGKWIDQGIWGGKLSSLELHRCPETAVDAFLPNCCAKTMSLKSLAVDLDQLLGDSSGPALRHICGIDGLAYLHIICRRTLMKSMSRNEWKVLFENTIESHPSLKTLEFTGYGLDKAKSPLFKTTLEMVQSGRNPVLERVIWDYNGHERTEQINKVLHDQHILKEVRESQFRQALLPKAILKGTDRSHKNFVYSLLREHADIWA
jgi:hypothetical protein